jgi:hypothetical protein
VNTCEPCTLRETGRLAEAELIEMYRAQSFLLAFLQGKILTDGDLAHGVDDCPACVLRLATFYLGAAAGYAINFFGSQERATEAVAQSVGQGPVVMMENIRAGMSRIVDSAGQTP